MIDQFRKAVQSDNAFHYCTVLRADDAGDARPDGTLEPSIVAPATYAPNVNSKTGEGAGARINVLRLRDHVEIRTVLSSPGAQAHRFKRALREASDEDLDLPLPRVKVAGTATDPLTKVTSPWHLDVLDLPHGATDAYLRYTDQWKTFDPFEMAFTQLDLRDNVTKIYAHCPHMLLVGGWELPNAARQNCRVRSARRSMGSAWLPSTWRSFPTIGSSRWSGFGSRRNGPTPYKGRTIALPEKIVKELRKNSKTNTISRIGLGDIPASGFTSRIVIDYAVAKATISLAGLRQMRFKLGDKYDPAVDLAGRTAAAALGVLMNEVSAPRSGYYLRSGCSSPLHRRHAFGGHGRRKWRLSLGSPMRLMPWLSRVLFPEAVKEAEARGLRFSAPLEMTATKQLDEIVSQSTRGKGDEGEAA